MEIKDEDIVGTFTLNDGSKYIFLSDKTVYSQSKDGKITKIELNKSNIKKINDEIGEGSTDVIK